MLKPRKRKRLQSIKDLCLILTLTVIVIAVMGVEGVEEEATRSTEGMPTLIQVTMRSGGRRNQKESQSDDPQAQVMMAVMNMIVDLKKRERESEAIEDTGITIQGQILRVNMKRGRSGTIKDTDIMILVQILMHLILLLRMIESEGEVMQSIINVTDVRTVWTQNHPIPMAAGMTGEADL